MPKKIVEDVLPPPRRSIRDIPLSDSKISKETRRPRAKRAAPKDIEPVSDIADSNSIKQKTQIEIENIGRPRRGRRLIVLGAAVFCLGLLVILSSTFLVRAAVEIEPKKWSIGVNSSLNTSTSSPLVYNLISISDEVSRTVPVNGEKEVQERASGEIVIFNNHSTASQVLVKNTRFQTPSGLIFRIQNQISIPGRKTVNGQIVPGSVKAMVFADAAGEKYNVGLADFTIPGFAGDPRFKTITAKSDPNSPITGGFMGKRKVAKESDIKTASESIEKELIAVLKSRVTAETPTGKIFLDGGSVVSFEDVSSAEDLSDSDNNLVIKKRGTLVGALFDEKSLITTLSLSEAKNFPKELTADVAEISDVSLLSATLSEADKKKLLADQPINLNLNGTIKFTAILDPTAIKSSLLGQKRRNFNTIMRDNPLISSAELKTYPGWAQTLPKAEKNIKVEIET